MNPASEQTDVSRAADARSRGMRRINIIWEVTQAIIALAVSGATLYVAGAIALSGRSAQESFILLSNSFFLVVGFYFSRVNHDRTEGIGGRR